MQSMTGYGKAEYRENGITLTVEIKTVNNRFLDVIPKYPRNFVQFDDLIRKTVQEKLSRGRVELFVSYENLTEGGVTLVVNQSLAGEYVKAADELSKKFGVVNDLTAVSLMRLPDVATQSIAEEDSAALGEILKSTLNRALDALNAMRKVEGEKLANDVYSRSVTVEKLVENLCEKAPEIKTAYENKLRERMEEVLGSATYDETRLLQEVALFADKSDVNEELTRLKSHISQLRAILSNEKDAGKKLDFLMQEFNRETNTVCSKANSVEITKIGLALKNEIEKMREQVQNIE